MIHILRELASCRGSYRAEDSETYTDAWEALIDELRAGAVLPRVELVHYIYIYRRKPFEVWHLQTELSERATGRIMYEVVCYRNEERAETYRAV